MMGSAVTSAVWSAGDTRRRRRRPDHDHDHDHDQEVNDDDLHRTLDELHRTTAWTWTETVTESYETDRFLASLQSPAHQSLFVIQHALRSAEAEKGDEGGKEEDDDAWTGVTAERILSMHCQHLLKPGRRFVVNGGNWKAPGPSSACPSNDSNDNNDCRLLLSPGLNYTIRGDDEEVPGGWRAIAVACGSDSSLSFAPGNKKSRSVSIAESIVEVASSGGRPACATKAKMAGRAAGGATPKTTTTTTAATTAETAAATTNRATTTKAKALLCHALLRSLYVHLHRTLGTDLRNGTSADVALLLSMVDLPDPPADHDNGEDDDDRGTKDQAKTTTTRTAKPGRSSYGLVNSILGVLCHVAALELRRGKNKKARRAADILRTVERLAAAGCERSGGGHTFCPHYEMALREAAASLPGSRGYHDGLAVVCTASSSRRLDLTLSSPRSLLCLWRRMKPFHKATASPPSSTPIEDAGGGLATTTDLLQPHLSPILRFDDPTLPLVVDVGCGLGVSLIGLAARGCDGCLATTTAATTSTTAPNGSGSSPSLLLRRLDWSRCNYLGADLSMEAVRWATSLTGRWQLGGRCQFCHASAETLLEYLLCLQRRSEAAAGRSKGRVRIALMMLQFPTPYRLAQLLPPPPLTAPAGDNANSRCCDDTATDGGGGANDVTTGSDSCVGRTGKSESSSPTAVAGGCNETLPLGPNDDSFMANPRILRRMAELLSPTGDDDGNANDDDDDDDAGPSLLLVQSNCEDVALHIHDSLLATGAAAAAATTPPSASGEIGDDAFVGTIEAVPCDKPRLSMRVGDGDDGDDDDDGAGGVTPPPTARTLAWLQQQSHQMVHDLATAADAAEIGTATATTASTGGPPTASATTLPRRAVGPGWSADPLLPVWTETEASCHHQKTPIHRCLFRRKR